ncbi:uncharacterized protein [Primulina eburnea]|uniref:uncharacterized protein isoform X2 n=1 Tax=Primulina eburnea TaxID=1245227 RepID=UPI003C6C8C7D
MEGRIAKELYSGVLQSTSVEGIGSTSTQAHQNLHDSELDYLWYDNNDSSRESSIEKLKIPSDMDREWQMRHDQFHTIGYRDGLIAGKLLHKKDSILALRIQYLSATTGVLPEGLLVPWLFFPLG